ncbi:MAG: hypothetical protein R2729_21100 [Bryobacteraceae bacterium]
MPGDTHELVAEICSLQTQRASDTRGLPALLAQHRLLKREAKAAEAAAPKLGESPEWARVRAAIMMALDEYPEAREAVVRALNAL